MESKWVDRDGSNNIILVYSNEQFDGQEKLTDQDQEVIDFLAPPPPPLTDAQRIDRAFSQTDAGHVTKGMFLEFENRISALEGGPVKSEIETLLEAKLP